MAATLGCCQLAEEKQADALVHAGLHEGGGEHQASHDEPARIAPVQRGDFLAETTPVKVKSKPMQKATAGSGMHARDEADHGKDHHGQGHLQLPDPLVGDLSVRLGQVCIFQLLVPLAGSCDDGSTCTVSASIPCTYSRARARFTSSAGIPFFLHHFTSRFRNLSRFIAPFRIDCSITRQVSISHCSRSAAGLSEQPLPQILDHNLRPQAVFGPHVPHPLA